MSQEAREKIIDCFNGEKFRGRVMTELRAAYPKLSGETVSALGERFINRLISWAKREDSEKTVQVAIMTPDSLNRFVNTILGFTATDGKIGEDVIITGSRNQGTGKISFKVVPSYKYLLRLLQNIPGVHICEPVLVLKGDKFDTGTDTERHYAPTLLHKPNYEISRKATVENICLAFVPYKINGEPGFSITTKDDIIASQKVANKFGESAPWRDWFGRMVSKTAFHRLFKLLPIPTEKPEYAQLEKMMNFDAGEDFSVNEGEGGEKPEPKPRSRGEAVDAEPPAAEKPRGRGRPRKEDLPRAERQEEKKHIHKEDEGDGGDDVAAYADDDPPPAADENKGKKDEDTSDPF